METQHYFDALQFVIDEIDQDPKLLNEWKEALQDPEKMEKFVYPIGLFAQAVKRRQEQGELQPA